MTGLSNMNIVIAQGHMVFKLQDQRQKNLDLQQHLADEMELKERQKKKAQVESPETGNRIEIREDETRKEGQHSTKEKRSNTKQEADSATSTHPESTGSHIDIKV